MHPDSHLLPAIKNKICEKILIQEYWHNGQQTTDIHILFLKIKGANWFRIFFDAGVFFCKEVETPDSWDTTLADEFHYPQTEIAKAQQVHNVEITQLNLILNDRQSELRINFANGVALRLNESDDSQTLEFSNLEVKE